MIDLTQSEYTAFPNRVLFDPSLNAGAKVLYAVLLHDTVDGECSLNEIELAARASIGARSARRYLKELQGSGLIRVIRKGLGQPNAYLTDMKKPLPVRIPAEKKATQSRQGYIYVIRTGKSYKIGKSSRKGNRIATHNASSPWPLDVLLEECVYGYDQVERDLHARFADKRIRNEWFALAPDDMETIADYLKVAANG